ncbi:hypothetical protein BDV95DRAFT_558459 [Massariosphaeria phaeospora]|uniref:Uncharacterized protein n=1 Tax=Massariosphaeria phaeospora TaxID=100035 RepID=A0A7C8IIA4_9PLEO|nr:hypothetical protein BDV95DRAFT_558459 [Massariosphaeria phaeospora]
MPLYNDVGMFSSEDIEEIFRTVAPRKLSGAEALPPLNTCSSRQEFLTSKYITHKFEHLATTQSQRVSVSSFANELGISSEVVLQITRAHSDLALLSEDGLKIVTLHERDSILDQFQQLITSKLVSKASFAHDSDISIESLQSLLYIEANGKLSHDDWITADDHVTSKSYEKELLKAINQYLDDALRDNTTITISPAHLPGSPPPWYMSQQLERLLKDTKLDAQFHIDRHTDHISCVPRQHFVQKRDAEIARLQNGDIPYLAIDTLSKQFPGLHPSPEAVKQHLSAFSEIYLNTSYAISQPWFSHRADDCVRTLNKYGHADSKTEIEETFPEDQRMESLARLEKHIITAYAQGSDEQLRNLGRFILTASKYNDEQNLLLNTGKTVAANHWQRLGDAPDKEIRFQIADVVALLPSDQPLIQALLQTKDMEKMVEEHYWSAIKDMESQNEARFSSYWAERVVSRVRNYTKGLDAVDEVKLREQLADLLSTYFQKELLPDSIAKARSQGVMFSRKTRKNIQKLEGVLKSGKMDLSSAVTAINRFDKKEGIQEPDDAAIAETKRSLISDMVRRVQRQKQTDGPLLFLTLVIVVFARHHSGVVYATGKFAPKLLKQLKPLIDTEQYEQLETWKDLAKAGTLSTDDKDSMKRLAAEE